MMLTACITKMASHALATMCCGHAAHHHVQESALQQSHAAPQLCKQLKHVLRWSKDTQEKPPQTHLPRLTRAYADSQGSLEAAR